EAAIKGALKEHELKLELLLIAKDSSLGNEEKKVKNLTTALEAVRDFAKENGVVLDKPKVSGEEISLKEIHLSEKENYSKALVVNTWQEANDFIKNKKWNNDTVYFKVVWKDGETFERKLDQLNAQLYEKKSNPLSDFVYQYNLTISQMKPLKGSHLKDADISNAGKIVEGYSFSDKKNSSKEITVELDEIVPVPGVDVDFGHLSTAGERNRISAETHKQISKRLQNSKTDLFYYKDAAWTIVKGSTHAILELPEMISNAKSYYEKVYKTSDAYLKKQGKETGIIKGLEAAYWTKEDNKYPQNKAFVNGMEFNQSRLRKAIEDKLEKLPLDTLQNIADELSKKFGERRAFDTYEKGYVTIGKTGDKRKATLIAIYVDNMIVDNDLTDKDDYPVMTFMVDLLFADSQKFVDLPQHIEKQAPSKMKKQSQHELNKEIEAFIEKKDKEGSSFKEEEKNYIRQYTGSGGLIKEGAAGRGVLYEYYTPDVVVQKMWGMAFKYGYDGGSVLEPSVGTGNFLKYAPKDAIVFGFETNHFSARIAQILYPNAHIHEKSFESLFFAGNIHLKDDFDHPPYSLVIGNPPYGDFTGKYAGMGEKQWTGATEYDQYFILRGLDLLKKGGLLVFVVPSSFLSYNVKSAKVKEKIASKVDLMDAYRLPIRTFDTTDIGTDILLLRKK
ncbi:MAG: N-6 DNA methylase, partial [Bacteroidia bacterium]|nr:N-6 DNA methylase [Bacteroidia bacterium]